MPPWNFEAMAQRLAARIALSAAAHAPLLTIRRNEGVWRQLCSGIRFKPLWRGLQGSSVLIELAPGASLPTHRHNWLEEGIVLNGSLQIGEQNLAPFDFHVSPAGSRHEPIRSKDGALAFLRGTSLGHGPSELRELVGGLWPFGGAHCRTVFDQDEHWMEFAPGVLRKDLWTDGAIASRFYRFAAGASVDGHPHAMDEECMMLSGEVFLGDILLRAGDYHLAPAGSLHGEVFSDTGALFYVRAAAY
jgi:quercetin dioxygenase-like cupin family protein